jgi:hypothetical protein
MFRQRFTLLAAASLALGAALVGSQAAGSPAAAAAHTVNVCVMPAGLGSQCMNDWDGNLSTYAQAVRFYHYGNSGGNNSIYLNSHGTIHGCGTSGGFQPFANGSGLNCRYDGRPVYQLEWGRVGRSGVCIAGDDISQNAFNFPCNGGPGTWFVYSSSRYLVGVGASNVRYDDTDEPNVPVWLGDVTGDGNGAHVYLTDAQSLSLTFGFPGDAG